MTITTNSIYVGIGRKVMWNGCLFAGSHKLSRVVVRQVMQSSLTTVFNTCPLTGYWTVNFRFLGQLVIYTSGTHRTRMSNRLRHAMIYTLVRFCTAHVMKQFKSTHLYVILCFPHQEGFVTFVVYIVSPPFRIRERSERYPLTKG